MLKVKSKIFINYQLIVYNCKLICRNKCFESFSRCSFYYAFLSRNPCTISYPWYSNPSSFGVQNKVPYSREKRGSGILLEPIKPGRFHEPKVSFRTKRSDVSVSRSCNLTFIIVASRRVGNGPLNAVVGTIPGFLEEYIPRRNIARGRQFAYYRFAILSSLIMFLQGK